MEFWIFMIIVVFIIGLLIYLSLGKLFVGNDLSKTYSAGGWISSGAYPNYFTT